MNPSGERYNLMQKTVQDQQIYEIGRSVLLWAQLDHGLEVLLMHLLGHVLSNTSYEHDSQSTKRMQLLLHEVVQVHRSRQDRTKFDLEYLNKVDEVVAQIEHLRLEKKAIPCFCGCAHGERYELHQLLGLVAQNVLEPKRLQDLYRLNQATEEAFQTLTVLLNRVQETGKTLTTEPKKTNSLADEPQI